MAAISTMPGDFSASPWSLNVGGGTSFTTTRDVTCLDYVGSSTGSYTQSTAGWDLTGSSWSCKLALIPGVMANGIEWRDNLGTTAYYRIIDSATTHNWTFQKTGVAVGTAIPDSHMRANPYLRIREASGTTYLEHSANGTSGWAQYDNTQNTANITTITNIGIRVQPTASATQLDYFAIQEVNGTSAPSRLYLQELATAVDSAGSWTNSTNAIVLDSTNATNTGAVQNTEYPIDMGGYSFSGLPSGATIHNVRATCVASTGTTSRAQCKIGFYDSSLIVEGSFANYVNSAHAAEKYESATPTRSQLQSANFFIRFINKRTASQATTSNLTGVLVTVDYTPAAAVLPPTGVHNLYQPAMMASSFSR